MPIPQKLYTVDLRRVIKTKHLKFQAKFQPLKIQRSYRHVHAGLDNAGIWETWITKACWKCSTQQKCSGCVFTVEGKASTHGKLLSKWKGAKGLHHFKITSPSFKSELSWHVQYCTVVKVLFCSCISVFGKCRILLIERWECNSKYVNEYINCTSIVCQ